MNEGSDWRLVVKGLLLSAVMMVVGPLAQAQTYTVLDTFNGTDGTDNGTYGTQPQRLIQATNGDLYGTTVDGGAHGQGTVFKITPSGTLTTVYSFCSKKGEFGVCTDGANPVGGLIQATNGELYGTTFEGGANASGTVFKIAAAGTLTTIYNFCSKGGCADGGSPYGLIQATDGDLYGTTSGYGANGHGTVFKITPSGTLTTLYSFCSQSGCADGAFPGAGLIQATNGDFYGTTVEGGANDEGTVFKITPGGTHTTLHSFCSGFCKDGAAPAGLIQATDGDLYGTTSEYAANGSGTVFKITPSGTLTTLYSFCSKSGCADGATPLAGLIQATNGDLYGTTFWGGDYANCFDAYGCGTIFRITPGGSLSTLHSFCSKSGCTDGANPTAVLIQATDGNFYGTTEQGGGNKCGNGCGTVFKLSVGLAPFVETQTTSGKVGAAVTILGTDLTGTTSVKFNDTDAKFKVVSASEITTTVPSGATTGYIEVEKPGGTLKSNVVYTVTP
jgi:uncharacterized repeat protein (TIGR03803 family)